MSVSFRSLTFSRLAGAVAALWLGCTGPVWAGDGGGDLGSLNSALQTLCTATLMNMFGVTLPSCPQLPSVTQGVLQLAAWNLLPPEMIRATNNIAAGAAVDAGNASLPPAVIPITPLTNFTAITAFPVTGTTLSNLLLPNLRPLAFTSSSTGPATAAQLFNPNANKFLYAVASGFLDNGGQPDTIFLFYEDTSRTNPNLKQGQIVAKMSLPLTILSSGTESLVTATLQFRATKTGDCSASTVLSTLWPNGITPDLIGVDCAVVFAPSPVSAKSHAIFEVAVPLIVTNATDPLYFSNPIANVGSPFTSDVTGHSAGILGPSGNSIGMGPTAVPLCSMTGTCPPSSPPPPSPVFALCADLPAGNGNAQAPVPSVAAYYAISTAGETLLSAALPATSTSVCPF
jgi:hypothetical protein